jgi:hypothetical protein
MFFVVWITAPWKQNYIARKCSGSAERLFTPAFCLLAPDTIPGLAQPENIFKPPGKDRLNA